MQVIHAPSVSAASAPRSLNRMIRDEEMRKTMRILNAERPPRRQLSYVERYRGANVGGAVVTAAKPPMPRGRLIALLAPVSTVAIFVAGAWRLMP